MKKFLFVLSLIILNILTISKQINIKYFDMKWGDSPYINGEFSYMNSNDNWKKFKYEGNTIEDKKDNFLWLRYKLPDENLEGKSFFFSSIVGYLEIYCNNKLLYRMINLNTLNKNKYYGYPADLIPLKQEYRNKYLYIRMYSDKKDIGFIGEIEIDDTINLYKKEKIKNIDFLFLGVFFTVLGFLILFFSISFKKKERKSIISLAILMLSSGIWNFEHPSIAYMNFLPPNIWAEFFEYAIITLPIGMFMFYEATFEKHYKKLSRSMWNINLMYVCIIGFLDFINKIFIKSTVNILFSTRSLFYILFFIEVFVIIFISFKEIFYGNKEARFYTIGILSVIGSSFYEILGERRMFVFWKRPLMQWGLFVFIILVIKIIFNSREKEKKMIKQYSKELKEKNIQLKDANAIKLNFIAKMSHELKTPLNGVLGFTKMLLDETFGELNEKQKNIIKTIYLSGKQMNTLVNETMIFSRIKRDKITLNKQNIKLHYLVERIIDTHKLNLKKNIEIINSVDKDCLVYGDEIRVYQIINNLIGNAIKFTQSGYVMIESIDKEKYYEINVEDTGIGIPEKEINDIFNEFKQLKNTNTGLGLGLAIVKYLVKMHGGSIRAENTNRGSKFIFTLPKK
ncbi:hypothetical protein OSSY52_06130 [Tepiditoga spiralis]|uniref:histidine kinase n=1 Tax=Tepiditoga spiralis TaxID=2108365 RepID=A0A7G1G8U6_9BACT|nr:sensor histidine kinase [Tepiditoga spiralis]BBE30472.1 hypothetical protein OSSY52_06130 [Tepiditoga spiralis]